MTRTDGVTKAGTRVVGTTSGDVRGAVEEGVASFKGIPYASPSDAESRFLAPRPVAPWTGIRDARSLGPQCPQDNPDFPIWLDTSEQSEGCQVLNVWVPSDAREGSDLPVMVWLHGGGFVYGSAGAPFYDGSHIASAGNVVVVSINHRLHAFGFTYLGADEADKRFAGSGNVGMLDIVSALQWVRDNIASFGGNADNVTLFGQSGGGGKVMTLHAMEESAGLFHKAIVLSGSPLRALTPEAAARVTSGLYHFLGIREGDVEALQKAPAAAFAAYLKVVGDPPYSETGLSNLLRYGPVVDGTVLDKQPWAHGAPTRSSTIPMIVGSTLHETVGFLGSVPEDLHMKPRDDADFARRLAPYAVVNTVQVDELNPLIATYREVMPEFSTQQLLVRISTDIGLWNFSQRVSQLKAEQGGAPVFSYECQWTTPCFDGMWAPHGIELPFVFNRPTYGTAWDGKDSEADRNAADPDGARFEVGKQMFNALINFARTGDPSTNEVNWPAYDLATRQTLIFDRTTRLVSDNRGEVRPLVDALSIG